MVRTCWWGNKNRPTRNVTNRPTCGNPLKVLAAYFFHGQFLQPKLQQLPRANNSSRVNGAMLLCLFCFYAFVNNLAALFLSARVPVAGPTCFAILALLFAGAVFARVAFTHCAFFHTYLHERTRYHKPSWPRAAASPVSVSCLSGTHVGGLLVLPQPTPSNLPMVQNTWPLC